MKKAATLNTFLGGLEMDYSPMVAPNNVLVNALNATTVTRNGDESMLLNDMGNGRVETAYLPEGFIPVGTVEFGGIIYIASYNPLTGRSLIGSFPSPERNITSDEVSACQTVINNDNFILLKEYTNSCNPDVPVDDDTGEPVTITMASIKSSSIKLKVLNSDEEDVFLLNPGDRFKIFVLSEEMLTKNAPTISDIYSTDANIVDATSRYLTIHIAALSTEGKVIALDSNLKWDWDGNNYAYYINEGGYNSSTGKVDLDEYRSLVSSAYNVYNSKVSGELALLFDLRTIESFTLTWDAEVNDNEDPDIDKEKKAEIIFYANYTSTSPMVNAKYIIATGSSLKVSWIDEATGEEITEEDIDHNGCSFGTVYELDTFDPEGLPLIEPNDKLYRANDGMDDDLEYITASFYYDKLTMASTIWNYEFTPAMPFGNIDWLAIKGSINFKLLGSGVINLIQWRYYISATTLTLAWGLEAYPEKNKQIFGVLMIFFDSNNIDQTIEDGTYVNAVYTYEVAEKKSYSGYFLDLIVFDDTDILLDKLYLVRIEVLYGQDKEDDDGNITEERETRVYFRWLYTTGLWNNQYLSGEPEDFKTLTLVDAIGFDVDYSVTDNINHCQDLYSTPVVIPETHPDGYSMLGANITTVNYGWGDHRFNATDGFAVDVKVTTNNSLFSTSGNNLTTVLDSGTVSSGGNVSRSGSSTTYELVESKTMGTINASNGEIIGIPYNDREDEVDHSYTKEDVERLIYNLSLGYAIDNDQKNYEAIDAFNAYISSQDTKFNVNLEGVIFSKINADIENKTCHTLYVIKPLLSEKNDLADLNLVDYPLHTDLSLTSLTDKKQNPSGNLRFSNYYRLWAHDTGSGHRTVLRLLEYNDDAGVGLQDRIASGMYSAKGKRGDDWLESSWGDQATYSTYIMPNLTGLPGPLLVIQYSTDGKQTVSGLLDGGSDDKAPGLYRSIDYLVNDATLSAAAPSDPPRTEYMGFWAKNNNPANEVLPLNFFSKLNAGTNLTTTALAAVAASIYNSIYHLKNVGDLALDLDRVKNINYLGDVYYETWSVDVKTNGIVSDSNIMVGAFSLEELQNQYITKIREGVLGIDDDETDEELLNKDAGTENITYSKDNLPIDFSAKTLSHEFKLTNSDIWEEYNALSSTSISYAVYPEDQNTIYALTLDLSVKEDGFYVMLEDGTLAPLNSETAKKVCLAKALSYAEEGIVEDRIICVERGLTMEDTGASSRALAMIASITYTNGDYIFDGAHVGGSGFMRFEMKQDDESDTCTVGGCPTFNFGVQYYSGRGTYMVSGLFSSDGW